jgi:3-methyl-2-oxobutanoate hydroxymethyltransferase
MSVWNPGEPSPSAPSRLKVTVPSLIAGKQSGHRVASVTAYDFPSARLADAAGIDLILVGDSLAMTMLGYDSTLPVGMDEMLLFTRAVRRGVTRALLVADMPFGSYQVSPRQGLRNALRFVKDAGAEAVKVEGGRERAGLVRRLVEAEIPVLGHLGLTPQAVHRMGGYKVQARTQAGIEQIREDAHLLAGAGCFALVLEGIPREVAAVITAELPIPTIGIGAGPECDGQVLVWHDLLGLTPHAEGTGPAKFVRSFLEGGKLMADALSAYRDEVHAGTFPADDESYHLTLEARGQLEASLGLSAALAPRSSR